MNKVICDICGTSYPSSAQRCPICGSSREYALEHPADDSQDIDFLNEEVELQSVSRRKNREIFDFDEVNQVKSSRQLEEEDFDDEEEYEEEPRTNVGLVIILVILIVLLLLTAGFFFLRYLMPNMTDSPEVTEPIVTTAPAQTEPVETGVPCTNLSIDGGKMELGKDGKKLLNVRIYPEDTTDALTMVSGDESIVTVSEDGTVTAVGEGQTVITITCGAQQISCNVTVDFSIGEETVPAEDIPGMQVEDNASTEATDAASEAEATVATEAAKETPAPDETLKLKKDDITISSNYTSVQLELEGDVDPESLSWFTMDSTVAIVHGGLVTSTGSGLTKIYGEYGGQQVMCIVRCIF